jgi:hypothetical protein
MSFTDVASTFLVSLFEEFAMMMAIMVCFASIAWYRRRHASQRSAAAATIPVKSVWEHERKFGGQRKARSNRSSASTTDDSDPTAMCDDSSDTETVYSSTSRLSNRRGNDQRGRLRESQKPGNVTANLEKVLEKLDPQDVAVVRALLSSKDQSKQSSSQNSITGRTDPRGQRPWQNRSPTGTRDDTENSLRTNLRKLAAIDTARIMMVKKISKLGLNSPKILTDYFSKFGTVTDVFVTHAIDKRADRLKPRVRPASIGFVVMDSPEAASAALSLGLEQDVNGVMVYVGTYENVCPKSEQHLETTEAAEADEDALDDGEDISEEIPGDE